MDGFETFWAAYPRRTAKAEARKAWAKLQPDDVLLEAILAALAWQTKQWDDVKFVPHPATWLRGERWEDEPIQVVAKPRNGYRPSLVPRPDWRSECDHLHGGACTNAHYHEAKKAS